MIWKTSPLAYGAKSPKTSFMTSVISHFLKPEIHRETMISAGQSQDIFISPEGCAVIRIRLLSVPERALLLILLSQLLGNDAVYAIEDPSYRQAGNILTCLGKRIRPVPLDANGISIGELKISGATIAYVTPSHHFPLGNIMPIKRRLELLSWAAENDSRYIIEDDYDSEFRYKGKPVPSLQGIDSHEKVIYLGTFSKAVAPSIRISYMVLPAPLLSLYQKRLSFYSSTVARTEQKQMYEFISRGHFERHLNRMRNIYKAKRDYILSKLSPYSEAVEISGETSGLHMLLTFKDGRSAKDILSAAKARKIILYDLSAYYLKPQHMTLKNTVILGYGALTEAQLKVQMPLLLEALFTDTKL